MTQENQTPRGNSDPIAEAVPDRALPDRLFLQIVCALALVIVVGFIGATVFFDTDFPTTFAALFFGVFVGVLIYVFVDPKQENKIAVGTVSLGGMAAVVAAFALLFADGINKEMNPALTIEEARAQVTEIEGKATLLERKLGASQREAAALKEELDELLAAGGTTPAVTDRRVLEAISTATPVSRLGKGVLELFQAGQGPFDPTIEDVAVRVAFHESIRSAEFHYCHAARPDLAGPVRFTRVTDSGEVLGPIQLDAANDIGTRNCEDPRVDYEAKLGCDAALKLLSPDEFTGCINGEPIRWAPGVTPFDLSATRLNPAMLPRER